MRCLVKENSNYPMGLGTLGNENINFVYKSRFTLNGNTLPESFVKSVKIDYFNKILKFSYIDNIENGKGIQGLIWAKSLSEGCIKNEELTLITYNEIGKTLYKVKFYNLSLEGHTSDFDYSLSEVSTQEITVNFEKYSLVLFSESNEIDLKINNLVKNGR